MTPENLDEARLLISDLTETCQDLSRALAVAQSVIAANDAKEIERAGNPFGSPQFELRTKLLAAQSQLTATTAELAEANRFLAILTDGFREVRRLSLDQMNGTRSAFYAIADAALRAAAQPVATPAQGEGKKL